MTDSAPCFPLLADPDWLQISFDRRRPSCLFYLLSVAVWNSVAGVYYRISPPREQTTLCFPIGDGSK